MEVESGTPPPSFLIIKKGDFMQMEKESEQVGKYNSQTLVYKVLNRETREIIAEQTLTLGKKSMRSITGPSFNNHSACHLRNYGFVEYDVPQNNFIIRYELK